MLLKLGMALSMPGHMAIGHLASMQPANTYASCHDHSTHLGTDKLGHADFSETSTTPSDASSLSCCHACCAAGLGMHMPMFFHPIPKVAPLLAWTHGSSLSRAPDLRPPIV